MDDAQPQGGSSTAMEVVLSKYVDKTANCNYIGYRRLTNFPDLIQYVDQ
jgi:hypothetical protein